MPLCPCLYGYGLRNKSAYLYPWEQVSPLLSHHAALQVRFYYSFTSRENLYIVMEYLSGGDMFSLLRHLGALDEEVARYG